LREITVWMIGVCRDPRRNPKAINMTTWNTSMPTAPGWFNASTERAPDVRRYWTGLLWSAPCYADDPEVYAVRARSTVGESQAPAVEWREPA